ncbi:MAG: tRNA pseudouridine(38-40) synthase TruA [Brevinematales bacterium]|nr:tRNA pseudouridine(38-40) synthase TruA [Brevinematales bacterium]
MRNILLTLSYDGSEFYGWQFQKKDDQPTVQGEIHRALGVILPGPHHPPSGIGRTDRGAHAIAYNANFKTSNTSLPIDKFPAALNSVLPRSIRIRSAVEVPEKFNACFSASAREYVYIALTSPNPHPIFRSYAHFIDRVPDMPRLNTVLHLFRGEHDFKRFSSGHGRSGVKSTVRTIYYFRAAELPGRVVFTVKGNGFLQGMIRTLISAALNYAFGKVSLEEIRQALDEDHRLASKYCAPVPAQGLYFKRGYYGSEK